MNLKVEFEFNVDIFMQRDDLIEHLKIEGVLRSTQLEAAFRDIDRKDFVEEDYKAEAYEDYALPIGHGATISQPTTVAFMLGKLDVQPGQKVLDIGSGSGWTAALLSHLVGQNGKVIAVEIVPELLEKGQSHVKNYPWSKVEFKQAKKGRLGSPDEEAFDRILVSAAPKELPDSLIKQLRPGRRMVIPIETDEGTQSFFVINQNKNGTLTTEEFPGFMFVPLR